MKKLIYKVLVGIFSFLCALGMFGGIITLGFSEIGVLWFILIAVVFMVLFGVLFVLDYEIEYEGMSIDERHELLRNSGYRYCPYCGEKISKKEEK